MSEVSTLRQVQNKLTTILGDTNCLICYEDFNTDNKIPIMICMEQHSCCPDCTIFIEKCPMCRVPVDDSKFTRNRLKYSVLEQIKNIDQLIKQSELKQLEEMQEIYGNDFEEYNGEKQKNNCEQCFKVYLNQKRKRLANFQIRKIKTSVLQRNKKNNDQNYVMLEV